MKFKQLKQEILNAESLGNLLTAKHDPTQIISLNSNKSRSVVSHEVAGDLRAFIESEQYSVVEYYNREKPNSPMYWTLNPYPGTLQTVAGSGVTGTAIVRVLDTCILVSGTTQGLHMFAEDSAIIKNRESSGTLYNKRVIKTISFKAWFVRFLNKISSFLKK